ncbi:hypothetical protein [Streptomyces pactum]|uniref:hypothetical protein n=1 Tax=Streptomyces pactum TaxID=68249 RepID=UPI0006E18ADB|nr:hypothetical protein [Streptomyces pactum]
MPGNVNDSTVFDAVLEELTGAPGQRRTADRPGEPWTGDPRGGSDGMWAGSSPGRTDARRPSSTGQGLW